MRTVFFTLWLCLGLGLGTATAASLTLTPVDSKWSRITAIDTSGMRRFGINCPPLPWGCTTAQLKSGIRFYGGSLTRSVICLTRALPDVCSPAPSAHYTNEGVDVIASSVIGTLVPASVSGAATWDLFSNSASAEAGYYWPATIINTGPPTPPSCIASTPTVMLSGVIGEQISGNTTLNIRCSVVADLSLDIDNGGAVSIGEGGEVRLTFAYSGTTTVVARGEYMSVLIDGVLHKDPSGPGTYQGVSIVRMNLL